MPRNELSADATYYAFNRLEEKLKKRLLEKGTKSLTSTHEIYGILAEEFNKELLDALHSNNQDQFEEELVDIAVGCIVGIMSRYDKGLDW